MANHEVVPVLDNAACEAMIAGTREGVLAMCNNGVPYALPVNFGYLDGRFYFHCGIYGKKLDTLRVNPNVSFCIYKYFGEQNSHGDPRCHGFWQSVLAFGQARIIENNAEKAEAFQKFMSWYGVPAFVMNPMAAQMTLAIEMTVDYMTVRQEATPEQYEYYLWKKQS